MKSFAIVAAVLSFGYSCMAQTTIVAPKTVKFDDVTVSIGMAKAALLGRADASQLIELEKLDGEMYLVYKKPDKLQLGTVFFKNGTVESIILEEGKRATGAEAKKLFNALYQAMQKLKNKPCSLSTFVSPDPENKFFKFFIDCGADRLQVMSIDVPSGDSVVSVTRVVN